MIHLRPAAEKYAFSWILGSDDSLLPADGFLFTVKDYSLSSFSVFLSVIDSFNNKNISPETKKECYLLLQEIKKNIEITERSLDESQTGFLASGVTYAIMRRISRESAYTASVIDRGAKLFLNLIGQEGFKTVTLQNINYCDKASVKIFSRAILICSLNINWRWIFNADPFLPEDQCKSMFTRVRNLFFLKLQVILKPQLRGNRESLQGPEMIPGYISHEPPNSDLFSISKELILQNYDYCILACGYLIASTTDAEVKAEAYRLSGLALINFGRLDDACKAFETAEKCTNNIYKKAHIAYLQGLAAAKRHYQLDMSEKHYQRGLSYLDSKRIDTEADQLERAWIYNGRAMNRVLADKKEDTLTDHRDTYNLLTKAFDLVKEGDGPAREYLRFNLLANTGFLMEIYKKYEYAIRVFELTFDNTLQEAYNDKLNWDFVLNYRVGLLKYKAGSHYEAMALFDQMMADLRPENISWYMFERLCRAAGYIKLNCGDVSAAIDIFNRGLEISLAERSAQGASYHGRGLISCFYSLGAKDKCSGLFERLKSEQVIIVSDKTADLFSALEQPGFLEIPSPKLPAYIPELDFEDVPKIDLNQYLADQLKSKTKVSVW